MRRKGLMLGEGQGSQETALFGNNWTDTNEDVGRFLQRCSGRVGCVRVGMRGIRNQKSGDWVQGGLSMFVTEPVTGAAGHEGMAVEITNSI